MSSVLVVFCTFLTINLQTNVTGTNANFILNNLKVFFFLNCVHDLTAWELNQVSRAQVTVMSNYAFLVSGSQRIQHFYNYYNALKTAPDECLGAPIGIINMCFDG